MLAFHTSPETQTRTLIDGSKQLVSDRRRFVFGRLSICFKLNIK